VFTFEGQEKKEKVGAMLKGCGLDFLMWDSLPDCHPKVFSSGIVFQALIPRAKPFFVSQ
jgi:hypothetical protein